mmetsp:Transcript_6233/g.13873  ORF Transcript_6233/g.13873 Transcript_6233/m.13873 type:complete len:111 (+) Transcript_6233:235-567(+)
MKSRRSSGRIRTEVEFGTTNDAQHATAKIFFQTFCDQSNRLLRDDTVATFANDDTLPTKRDSRKQTVISNSRFCDGARNETPTNNQTACCFEISRATGRTVEVSFVLPPL